MPTEPSDLTTDLEYVYTTSTRIDRVLGTSGATQWSDHNDDGFADTSVYEDAIYWATCEIDLYCRGIYSPADMVNNSWVVYACTRLAAWKLCQNRGNSPPEALENEAQRLLQQLESIRMGDMQIPGLSQRADMRPVMVNRVVDRRYTRRTVRVDRATSTDSPTVLRQDRLQDYDYYTG